MEWAKWNWCLKLPELNRLFKDIDKSWISVLKNSFNALENEYLEYILKSNDFFPNTDNFLNAFKTLSLDKTKYILFGQDPYPRVQSAIGYAFIDGRVNDIFSPSGLSKEINRATSLRNFIKMLLLCEGKLYKNSLTQEAIAKINKENLCKKLECLKNNFEKNGVLLLNMSLIFSSKEKSKFHLKKWKNFIECFLNDLKERGITLILFGKAAKDIEKFESSQYFKKIVFPHPYNISFITNNEAHRLFKPMSLLSY